MRYKIRSIVPQFPGVEIECDMDKEERKANKNKKKTVITYLEKGCTQ